MFESAKNESLKWIEENKENYRSIRDIMVAKRAEWMRMLCEFEWDYNTNWKEKDLRKELITKFGKTQRIESSY